WARAHALARRDTPSLRTVRKALSAELRNAAARDVVAIGEALAQTTPRWLGLEIITKHRAALASLTLKDVERMGLLDSWYSVDAFGGYISGPAWRDRRCSRRRRRPSTRSTRSTPSAATSPVLPGATAKSRQPPSG